MKIFLTRDVPISNNAAVPPSPSGGYTLSEPAASHRRHGHSDQSPGYTEGVVGELFASGHDVVVVSPLFAPEPDRLDGYIMNQMWAFNLSTLIYGRPDVVLNPNAGTWNYVTSAFPTVFVNHPGTLDLHDITRRGIQRADGIIALTQGDASAIARSAFYNVPPSKITVIPQGLDPKLFDTTIESSRKNLLTRYAKELHGIDEYAFWIVTSTDVVDSGGIDTLIRAAQTYETDSDRPVMTLIVGVLDETHLEKYQHLAERLIIQGVYFVNELKDRGDATRFLKEADVVVISGRDGVSGLANDVLDIPPPNDQATVAAIRWAIKRIKDDTKIMTPLRTEMLGYLDNELRRTLGRLDAIKPVCSARCFEESANYIKFSTRQIATESLADEISIKVNASTKSGSADHTRSFDALTRLYGWDAVGSRIEDYLRKTAGRPSRMRGASLATSVDLTVGHRRERLNHVRFDEDVMESFERLEKTRGTAQFGRAFRSFDRTVSEYFGMRADFAHPLNMTAMPDPRGGDWGVFAEVARVSGTSMENFMEVLKEVESTPRSMLTGVEYQKPPMRPDATVIYVPFGKPRKP